MSAEKQPTSVPSGDGGSPAGCSTLPCGAPACTITSQTVATVPADRARTNVGVGEDVNLTFSKGNATWSTTGGKLSSTSGSNVVFTAPDRAASITITATGGGCTATKTLSVVEPSGVLMEKTGNTWHDHGIPSVGIHTNIYITPANVSFENIDIMEDDCVGAVTGYFIGTPLDGVHHSGHGAGAVVGVGPVVEGKGSSLAPAMDTAASGHCNFGTPYSAGTFDWPIPWKFSVGSGAQKQFTTVHQQFTINASGDMTVSKAGATGSATLNAPSSTY